MNENYKFKLECKNQTFYLDIKIKSDGKWAPFNHIESDNIESILELIKNMVMNEN